MSASIVSCIGDTPLVLLNYLHELREGEDAQIWVKLESKNASGSVKDRIAYAMVREALEQKKLTYEGLIVEPTSGNTGISLAMVAAALGIECCIVMPENMSIERRALIRAYGARLELTAASAGMEGAVRLAEEICAANTRAFMPNQFSNPCVTRAHYESTGPELYASFGQDIHALVAGVGTGGTISGTGLYLKERIPHLTVHAAEPSESPLLSQGKVAIHGIQGIGANFIPPILRQDILDEIILVSTMDALAMARKLFKYEGISCGISSGANVYAAVQLARQKKMQGKRIVTFICDSGEKYLSTELFS